MADECKRYLFTRKVLADDFFYVDMLADAGWPLVLGDFEGHRMALLRAIRGPY